MNPKICLILLDQHLIIVLQGRQMEYYKQITVVSGFSEPEEFNYPGQFIVEVIADHWGGGGLTLERSPLYKEKYGTVKDETGTVVNFTSNEAVYVPGIGNYRTNCSGFENMSGVEVLFYPYQNR